MIFPKEFLEGSIENLLKRSRVSSQVIYSTSILFIILVFSILPFIEIDVSSSAHGIIKSVSERVNIISNKNGLVEEVLITENKVVDEGELLLTFQTDLIDQQLNANKVEQNRINQFIKDIEIMLSSIEEGVSLTKLSTSLYQSEWSSYIQEQSEINNQLINSELKYARATSLYEKEVISESEFEERKFELESIKQRLLLLNENKSNKWENELWNNKQRLESLLIEEAKLKEASKTYYIKAPISGTLQNTIGISKNSVVYANQLLAEISPDTSLIAEVYVTPSDIGLLKEGMPVRFQIDAFNYNEWGYLNGRISEIPEDAIVAESGEIVFIVRCSFSSTELSLPNGYSASLKKGMTLQARFILTRRSLFQLLYDNVDDWLNPSQS